MKRRKLFADRELSNEQRRLLGLVTFKFALMCFEWMNENGLRGEFAIQVALVDELHAAMMREWREDRKDGYAGPA